MGTNNKVWNIDGKHSRQIWDELNYGSVYFYGFGNGSHYVHGDWYEIDIHHLKREGQYYTPDLNFDVPDPRLACPLTELCLGTLLIYLRWSKSDPDRIVTPVIDKLQSLNASVDIAHEESLGK